MSSDPTDLDSMWIAISSLIVLHNLLCTEIAFVPHDTINDSFIYSI